MPGQAGGFLDVPYRNLQRPAISKWELKAANRLRQILVNLVGNAVKFTQDGEVVILASVAAEDTETVALEIAVRDTGIGVAPEARKRIFNAFAQADGSTTRQYGGTGLGLTIACDLARMMGGDLDLASELGRGSTFRVTITCRKGQQPAQAAASAARLAAQRVLVVDDNDTNREIVMRMLSAWGAEAAGSMAANARWRCWRTRRRAGAVSTWRSSTSGCRAWTVSRWHGRSRPIPRWPIFLCSC